MLISMLKAVSQMLEAPEIKSLNDMSAVAFVSKVKCAKTIVDQIIENIDEPTPPEPTPPYYSTEARSFIESSFGNRIDAENTKQATQNKYLFSVDDEYKLRPVKGLDPNAMLEVDGVEVKHKDAVGKTFTKIKVL